MLAYRSESFWTVGTVSTLLSVLLLLASSLLPGIFCHRQNSENRGKTIACLLLGAVGSVTLVPLFVAVVLAVGEVPPNRRRKKCILYRPVWAVYGMAVFGFGIFSMVRSFLVFSGTYQNYRIYGIYLALVYLIVGFVLLMPFILRKKRKVFWGSNLMAPSLLILCSFVVDVSEGILFLAIKLFLIVGAVFIATELLRVTGGTLQEEYQEIQAAYQRPREYPEEEGYANPQGGYFEEEGYANPQDMYSEEERYVNSEGEYPEEEYQNYSQENRETDSVEEKIPGEEALRHRMSGGIRCTHGQYAGCQFPIQDGETLCLGTDPALVHIVFEAEEIAPLHLEITFRAAEDCYWMAVSSGAKVLGENVPLPEFCELSAGEMISFGLPLQIFWTI